MDLTGGTLPAGEACSDFAIIVTPDDHARSTVTQFDDGREVITTSASPTLTNADNGQSVVQRSRYMTVSTVNLETGDMQIESHGRMFVTFWPGDMGPDGTVVDEVSTLSVVGHQTMTLDLETFAIEAYTLDGQVIEDLCAVLTN